MQPTNSVTNRNDAEKLAGTELFCWRCALPELAANEFHIEDLKGLKIVHHSNYNMAPQRGAPIKKPTIGSTGIKPKSKPINKSITPLTIQQILHEVSGALALTTSSSTTSSSINS
jgi:hypothetical protein